MLYYTILYYSFMASDSGIFSGQTQKRKTVRARTRMLRIWSRLVCVVW